MRTDEPGLDHIMLHVLIFRTEESFVAQCLEADIATQADSREGVKRSMERVLDGYIEFARREGKRCPFEGLPRAPAKFLQEYMGAGKQIVKESFSRTEWPGSDPRCVPSTALYAEAGA